MKPVSEDQLHAYVDNELPAAARLAVEQCLADDPQASASVSAWREQKRLLHAIYDPVLAAPHSLRVPARSARPWSWRALAASGAALAVGLTVGWMAHDRVYPERPRLVDAARNFANTAAIAHSVYMPEVRHPVEVTADQEQHLVNWLSRRLSAPLKVPHLAESGWDLLGGRLLPGDTGPLAQFMYQDAGGRRLTLMVSTKAAPAGGTSAFRYEQRDRIGVFYWVDGSYNYALSADLPRTELLKLADAVYRELSRAGDGTVPRRPG